MKAIFNFESFTPPPLTEARLRETLERRRLHRQMVLLAVAGALLQTSLLLFSVLLGMGGYPLPSLLLFSGVLFSTAGSGVIAMVYQRQKGGGYAI